MGGKKKKKEKDPKNPQSGAGDGFVPEYVGGIYKVGPLLGSGSFGLVYAGMNKKTKQAVALKFEQTLEPDRLQYEREIYKIMDGIKGFTKLHWSGTHGPDWRVMVIDRLGPSVHDYYIKRFNGPGKCGYTYVYQCALQFLDRLTSLHDKGFIHRDLKPQNFVYDLACQTVYLVDYGSSRTYLYRDGTHKEHKQCARVVGSRRYCCLDNHYGMAPVRRDDMESLGYVLLYMALGRLPWNGVEGKDCREKWRNVREVKKLSSIQMLCQGAPSPLRKYMEYAKSLKFDQRPDYEMLKGLFQDALDKDAKSGMEEDGNPK